MNLFGLTDRGLIRKENQDSYDIWLKEDTMLAVVCDGMGGALSGNVASSMTTEIFSDCMRNLGEETPSTAMLEALEQANEQVFCRSVDDPKCAGMGTTIVAAYIQPDWHTTVLNVGDSRAYLIRYDHITQITRDHSLVADLVEKGKITPEQARTHPNKNIITRAVGTEAHTPGDIYELDLVPGEYVLLCSDGLSNVVTEQEIQFEVIFGGEIDTCCQRLLDIALERGAPDNVTIVLATVGIIDNDVDLDEFEEGGADRG